MQPISHLTEIFWDNYTVDPVDTLGVLLMVHTQL